MIRLSLLRFSFSSSCVKTDSDMMLLITRSVRMEWTLAFLCYSLTHFLSLSLSLAQHPNSSLGRLIVEVSRWHKIRNTCPISLLWMSDQLVAEDASYTTHNKHEWRKTIPSVEFEHTFPAIKHPQTHILDLMATGVDFPLLLKVKVKTNLTLEQATKAQRGRRSIALLFFNFGTRWSGWSTQNRKMY